MRIEVDRHRATIALDQQRRNALSHELVTDLREALREIRDDADVRVVVLASTHPKVFSGERTWAVSAPKLL